jgi:hypothetical protein
MNQYVYLNGAWSPSTPAINPGEGVLVVYPALRLTSTPVTNSPAGFFLSWPRGKLQASDTLNGPWETLTNTGPFRVNTEIQPASSKFYRVDESWDDALFGYPSGHPY